LIHVLQYFVFIWSHYFQGDYPTFDWTTKQEGMVLSAFFYGYNQNITDMTFKFYQFFNFCNIKFSCEMVLESYINMSYIYVGSMSDTGSDCTTLSKAVEKTLAQENLILQKLKNW
jgi:hypothetical protein